MTDIEEVQKACGETPAKPRSVVKIPKVSYEEALGFKEKYLAHIDERAAQNIPPLPLSTVQVVSVIEMIKQPIAGEEDFYMDLLMNRVPAGVDDAACAKADFLASIIRGEVTTPVISPVKAAEVLGTMLGGFNVAPLVAALDSSEEVSSMAAKGLKKTLLMFDAYYDVEEKMKAGNSKAKEIIESWANAEWFVSATPVPEVVTVTVFKVTGETNTDDLSPATDAWSRPDIPLHALAMLMHQRDGITNALEQIAELKKKGFPLAYVGDVVGTGSSRKSATNSILWWMGNPIPYIPNKNQGAVVDGKVSFTIGNKIAPIFFNTMEDSGALPIEMDVTKLNMGDVIDIHPYSGKTTHHETGEVLSEGWSVRSKVLFDEVRAGGRIPLILGRMLTKKACATLGREPPSVFAAFEVSGSKPKGWTLAQKMVGKACGVDGVQPGAYCEPLMTTVASQDTTGPMTRDELKDLACLGFSADLTMQSFCHTAAYPKPVDVQTHKTLPKFFHERGGVALRPGDGIIHSWVNRMLVPDCVGTGGDSHTRFPLGISFPAGSGLVAFAAATGTMPLDMPESVRVRFTGTMQPGITLRDLVHSIPYFAIQKGLLTVEKKGKKNIFNGRIIEIEGLPNLKCEQAFELSDATAERSAAGSTIKLNKEPIIEYLNSNITLLKWMVAEGYGDKRTLMRRVARMQEWLKKPELMEPDEDAEYLETLDIDMNMIKEPILCCPNDPDDAKTLSEVANTKVDEVFIGSCMTNIGHFRVAGKLLDKFKGALPTRLWIAPPTKMDQEKLTEEGYYAKYGKVGARTEMPGCSLCMGNQARVADNCTVVSTSTRNFPNRLGKGANCFLSSAEVASVVALLGRIPTVEEYMSYAKELESEKEDTFTYLNFNQVESYQEVADEVVIPEDLKAAGARLQAA